MPTFSAFWVNAWKVTGWCFKSTALNWDGENILTPLLQNHPVFIPMESLVIIWDFRLRILDLWHRRALSIYNRQNSLNIQFSIPVHPG
jgi:hypothetical protein